MSTLITDAPPGTSGYRTDTGTPHVTRRAGVCGGKACVAGSRVRVWDVVEWREGGATAAETRQNFPHLTIEQIEGALAYYDANEDEIRSEMAAARARAEAFRRAAGPDKLDAYR